MIEKKEKKSVKKVPRVAKSAKKSLALTPEQCATLARLVRLGNWVANAQRAGSTDDPRLAEYDALEQHLLAQSPLSIADEVAVGEIIADYDDEVFWDELCERLGHRDFHRRYSPEEIIAMGEQERFTRFQECVLPYEHEVEDFGIERLERMQTLADLGL